MHIPAPFAEVRREVLYDFIETNSFGTLVMSSAEGIDANHIPFELIRTTEPCGLLRGHVSRSNPLWTQVENKEVLVIFQGANTYISPALYPARKTHGKVAPSWNYSAVHAYGTARPIEDKTWILEHLTRLTDKHETGRQDTWSISEAPVEFIQTAANYVVGIEISITRLLGKFQASQQYKEVVRQEVVKGLLAEGSEQSASVARMIASRQSMHTDS
jgi:transcriptional regulator